MNRNDILIRVQESLLTQRVTIPSWGAQPSDKQRFVDRVAETLSKLRLGLADGQIASEAVALADMMIGLGVLQPYLVEPGVEEIVVRNGFVQIEKDGRVVDIGVLAPDAYFEMLARRVADECRRSIKADRPYVLVDLEDGSRFTAIVPDLSGAGTAINIRVFSRTAQTLETLARYGTFLPTESRDGRNEMDLLAAHGPQAFLSEVSGSAAYSLLVSGEFGAGKTTLLNAMTAEIPARRQLAVAETFRELQISHPHPLRIVVDPNRPNYPPMDEVLDVAIKRMRPDVIIIGEITTPGEALRTLEAANLGKRVWATIHSNSAYDAVLAMETLAMSAGTMPLPAIQLRISRHIHYVAHVAQHPETGRRYLSEIAAIRGLHTDSAGARYNVQTLYRADRGPGEKA
jgi:pilus assembly protein CpaF